MSFMMALGALLLELGIIFGSCTRAAFIWTTCVAKRRGRLISISQFNIATRVPASKVLNSP